MATVLEMGRVDSVACPNLTVAVSCFAVLVCACSLLPLVLFYFPDDAVCIFAEKAKIFIHDGQGTDSRSLQVDNFHIVLNHWHIGIDHLGVL